MKKFKCIKCGLCCTHLKDFLGLYADLDRGDGVCQYYDVKKKLCTIYDHRPLKCNVEKSYALIYNAYYSEEEYYALMKAGCKKLQKGE